MALHITSWAKEVQTINIVTIVIGDRRLLNILTNNIDKIFVCEYIEYVCNVHVGSSVWVKVYDVLHQLVTFTFCLVAARWIHWH